MLSYVRTRDGMLSSMLDTVPGHDSSYRVLTFSPGVAGDDKNLSRRIRTLGPHLEKPLYPAEGTIGRSNDADDD